MFEAIHYLRDPAPLLQIEPGCDCGILWDYKGLSLAIAKNFIKHRFPYCYYSGGVLHYRNPLHWLGKFLFCNFISPVFLNASAIVLPTQRECRRLRHLLPLYRGLRAHILHEIAPVDWTEKQPDPPCFRLGFMGRLDIRTKGLDVLLRAFTLARQTNPHLRLELAGPDFMGSLEKLRQRAATLGIADAVVFCGPVHGADKQRFFSRVDLFVHLCRWEAFGIGIVEAMLSRTPVLLSRKANLAEELKAADACCTVALEAGEVARQILALASDPHRTQELARKGQAWAVSHCSAASIGVQTRTLLSSICNGNPGATGHRAS